MGVGYGVQGTEGSFCLFRFHSMNPRAALGESGVKDSDARVQVLLEVLVRDSVLSFVLTQVLRTQVPKGCDGTNTEG